MSHFIQHTTAMVHPDIRCLEQYWQELRRGRVCPFRAEVDPRDIRSRIGSLFILEDLGQGNVRFRIAGTNLVDAFGMELRGLPVRAMMELRARRSFTELLAETMAEPGVGYARLNRIGEQGGMWEIILLPLRSEHGQIDRIIGALHPLELAEPASAAEPLTFSIEEMSITPVEITCEDRAIEGFAEEVATFAQPLMAAQGGGRPSLVAIEGGGHVGGDARPCGARPRLRLVKTSD